MTVTLMFHTAGHAASKKKIPHQLLSSELVEVTAGYFPMESVNRDKRGKCIWLLDSVSERLQSDGELSDDEAAPLCRPEGISALWSHD